MNEHDYIDLVNTINRIMGYKSEDNSGPKVVELVSFHIDFPKAEMAMNLEDITWPVKLEGPISYDYLTEKYEKALQNLEKYLRNLNAMLDHLAREDVDFSPESECAAELTGRLMKEKHHVNKRRYAIYKFLAKAKEHADEEALIESMRRTALDKAT